MALQADVLDIKGKVAKKINLAEQVFGIDMQDNLLHKVVKSYMANRRQGTHCAKTRSFVSGGGKKPFKQKGSGTARQGTLRAPHMPGGAVIHGPQPRLYHQKANRKEKSLALSLVLADKLKHKKLIVINDFALSGYSTKHVVQTLAALKVTNALLVDERKDDLLCRSARNISFVAAGQASEINSHNILKHEHLILTENALTVLNQRLGVN